MARVRILSSSSLLTARSQLAFWLANVPTYFGSTQRISDLAYGAAERQSLDIHVPAKVSNAPVVVFWYGGSWTSGRKDSYRFVGAALAQHGIVTAIPDYRLHPRVRFPAFLDDAAQAVAFVQSNIGQYGGDPQQIVLMGHSAGAHIAAYVANHPGALRESGVDTKSIRGFIGLAGPYALDPDTAVLNTIFASPYTHADWQPVRFASSQSPPTLLIHGLRDTVVAPAHTDAMYEALLAAGVPVEVARYEGRSHADTVAAFSWVARRRAPVLQRSVEFIQKVTAVNPQAADARR